MKVGLIDVDSHRWPNLCLMKLSAYHKARGDSVAWWSPDGHFDLVYKSRVFTDLYSKDTYEVTNADAVIRGGTGYGPGPNLPDAVEHSRPDYSLYPQFPDTAYGFLTRGCPRNCGFCIVSGKEGRKSVQTADLSEFWDGQRNIKLLDANLLACPDHETLLNQLADSRAYVDFTQGLDCRLLTEDNIAAINRVRLKDIHFAWDSMRETDAVLDKLRLYAALAKRRPHGKYATVYVLTNYGTTHDEDLYRVETLREMGFDPYVMIYEKPTAPAISKRLQAWVNNKRVFRTVPRFEDFQPNKSRKKEVSPA